MAFKTHQQMWDELNRTGAVWVSFDPSTDKFDFTFTEWRTIVQPPEWRLLLESIPNLEGRVMGEEVILPKGHKAKFPRISNTILACECGWDAGNISEIIEKWPRTFVKVINLLYESHLKMPHDEVEYICFTREWLDDLPEDFKVKLLRFISENKGVLHFFMNTCSYLLIDDAMSDAAIAQLSEMLEGHELLTRKMKVFRGE